MNEGKVLVLSLESSWRSRGFVWLCSKESLKHLFTFDFMTMRQLVI